VYGAVCDEAEEEELGTEEVERDKVGLGVEGWLLKGCVVGTSNIAGQSLEVLPSEELRAQPEAE
jgi:hypothetical protein